MISRQVTEKTNKNLALLLKAVDESTDGSVEARVEARLALHKRLRLNTDSNKTCLLQYNVTNPDAKESYMALELEDESYLTTVLMNIRKELVEYNLFSVPDIIKSFIVLEGPDGSGKSGTAKALVEHYTNIGHDVVHTRELGGTPFSEQLRDLVLKAPENDKPVVKSEMACAFASRYNHYEKVIAPSLLAGMIVICERFEASTYMYQIASKRPDARNVQLFNQLSRAGQFAPYFTIYLDVDHKTFIKRRGGVLEDDMDKRVGSEKEYNSLRTSYHNFLNSREGKWIGIYTSDMTQDQVIKTSIRYINGEE